MVYQVEEICEKMGMNPNQVFPVRNYAFETECNLHIDILNLRAQIQILRHSKSYLRDKIKLHMSQERAKWRETIEKEDKRKTWIENKPTSTEGNKSAGGQ